MLRLGFNALETNRGEFENVGIKTPNFDIEKVWEETRKEPIWLHFGGGNLFRAFHAVAQQRLIENGDANKGIIVASTRNDGLIKRIYHPHNNLSLNVVMKKDGAFDMEVVASVAESVPAEDETNWERLKEIFRSPSLQMVTFTITEKAYELKGLDGEITPAVKDEMIKGLGRSTNTIISLTSLLYERFVHGEHPVALVSTDNFSHNGDKLKEAVMTVAAMWEKLGFVNQEFIEYLNHPKKVSYPWTVIDKITPLPSTRVQDKLQELGLDNAYIVYRENASPIAPFVNTEESEYLVIEDNFPNGRPPLEKAGVYFTDQETVDRFERMKVRTCLNPLHTALAVFGCLLGYTSIAEEMRDPDLKTLVEKIGYDEGMKVVSDPGIIDPKEFIKEVLEVRFPNPNIPDTPQRIATDTSQKLPIRFGETIKLYVEREGLDVHDLTYIPLTLAAWCRYLMGIDDQGQTMKLSPDPLLPELQQHIKKIEFGNVESVGDHLRPILANKKIFGVNLYEVGLGEKVEGYFKEMITGPGAVRNTLHKLVNA